MLSVSLGRVSLRTGSQAHRPCQYPGRGQLKLGSLSPGLYSSKSPLSPKSFLLQETIDVQIQSWGAGHEVKRRSVMPYMTRIHKSVGLRRVGHVGLKLRSDMPTASAVVLSLL